MGATKKYYIEQNGFREEEELRKESELLSMREEEIYYHEFIKRNGDEEDR